MLAKYRLVFQSAVSLLLGIIIYILFRTPIGFFKLFSATQQPLLSLEFLPKLFQIFILYHFPDLCWSFSLVALLVFVTGKVRISIIISVVWVLAFEGFQAVGIIDGTPDIWDIVFSVASIIFFYYLNNFRRVKWKKREEF